MDLKLNSLTVQNYFGDAWNTFDFIIVLGSIIDIVVSQVNELKNQVNNNINARLSFKTLLLDYHCH